MKDNKGSILITTLWIMAILALLAMGIGFRASLEVRLSKYNMDRLQARYLAKAGVAKAQELLLNDTNEYDTLYECGVTVVDIEKTPEKIFGAESNKLGNGSFSVHYTRKKEDEEEEKEEKICYGMIDEERKININNVKFQEANNVKEGEYIRIVKGLLSNFTDMEKDAEEIVNAMLDWQDGGVSGDLTRDGGAEDFEYETEFGYSCKDAPFESIEELLLVKGVTPELFNEIKGYITTYSDGKININTAPEQVLNALINENEAYTDLVDRIVDARKGKGGIEGTSDDEWFDDMTDLLSWVSKEEGNPERIRISQLSNYFAFKSNYFRIISHGKVGKVTKVITCVVNKDAKKDPELEENPIKCYHEE